MEQSKVEEVTAKEEAAKLYEENIRKAITKEAEILFNSRFVASFGASFGAHVGSRVPEIVQALGPEITNRILDSIIGSENSQSSTIELVLSLDPDNSEHLAAYAETQGLSQVDAVRKMLVLHQIAIKAEQQKVEQQEVEQQEVEQQEVEQQEVEQQEVTKNTLKK